MRKSNASLRKKYGILKKENEDLKSNQLQIYKERNDAVNTLAQAVDCFLHGLIMLMDIPYFKVSNKDLILKLGRVKFIWIESEAMLDKMIDLLASPKYNMILKVADKQKFIIQHFVLESSISYHDLIPNTVEPIAWRRDKLSLYSLLSQLCDKEYLQYSQKVDFIRLMHLHFLDKDGNIIKEHSTEESIRHMKNNNTKSNYKSRETNIIYELISELNEARLKTSTSSSI